MARAVRYKDGTLMMPGSEAFDLYYNPPKNGLKVPGASKTLDQHMAELDRVWRKAEGRKPVAELTVREKMLEGRIPWDPKMLAALTLLEQLTEKYSESDRDLTRKFWEKVLVENPGFMDKLKDLRVNQTSMEPEGIQRYLAPLPIPSSGGLSEEEIEKKIKELCAITPPRLRSYLETLVDTNPPAERNISPLPTYPYVAGNPMDKLDTSVVDDMLKEAECKCYLCGGLFPVVAGEDFQPFDVVDLPNNDRRWVCSACEKGPQHQKNLSETELNHLADQSYQARFDDEG